MYSGALERGGRTDCVSGGYLTRGCLIVELCIGGSMVGNCVFWALGWGTVYWGALWWGRGLICDWRALAALYYPVATNTNIIKYIRLSDPLFGTLMGLLKSGGAGGSKFGDGLKFPISIPMNLLFTIFTFDRYIYIYKKNYCICIKIWINKNIWFQIYIIVFIFRNDCL